jgi:Ca2+-binding EF-hand superfamily protein
MGCTHGKASNPSSTGAVAQHTLLQTTSPRSSKNDKGNLAPTKHMLSAAAQAPASSEVSQDSNPIRSIFNKVDADAAGFADAKELAAAVTHDASTRDLLGNVGLDPQSCISNVYSQWYTVHDGKIDYEQFKKALKTGSASSFFLSTKPGSDVASKQEFPLRHRALRIFQMAEKCEDGRLDIMELVDGDLPCQHIVCRALGSGRATAFSQTKWLEKVKHAADTDHDGAVSLLNMLQSHIEEQKEHWPLREEALEVFRIGDRDGNGQLDMDELTEMRGSYVFAQAMMGNMDADKSGIVSKGEWLAYIKRLANESEASAREVLKLYRKQFAGESGGQITAHDVVKQHPMLESTTVLGSSSRWACC